MPRNGRIQCGRLATGKSEWQWPEFRRPEAILDPFPLSLSPAMGPMRPMSMRHRQPITANRQRTTDFRSPIRRIEIAFPIVPVDTCGAMIDALRKTFLAGLGATVVTAEKVESVLADLVQRGRLSADEAREVAAKIASESKQEFTDARSNLGSLCDEVLGRANVAKKSDLAVIEARLAGIEAAVKAQNQDKSAD